MQFKNKGFTLVELLVVVAIVAIMATIALPNMSTWLAGRRVASQAEQVANLLRFARTESVRLGVPVYVCPVQIKVDGTPDHYCNASYSGQGVAAFADSDKSGDYTRNRDVDLRSIILNGKDNEGSTNYAVNSYSFDGKKGKTDQVWVYYPNGTFGYVDKLGSNINLSSGYIKIQFTDSRLSSDKQEYVSTVLLVDSSGRVAACDKNTSDGSKPTKICQYSASK